MSATIFSTIMHKGGVGKTTLTTNLAGALSKKYKKKVLLVDLDGQANLTASFRLNPKSFEITSFDILTDPSTTIDSVHKINKYLDIIPSNKRLNLINFEILPNLDKYKNPNILLKTALDTVKDDYDYIFIDTPPELGLLVGNALVASHKIIIPFVPELFSVTGFIETKENIDDFIEKHNPELEIAGVIATMVNSLTTLHQEMTQQARAYCFENDVHMFDTVIPRSIEFAKSNIKGVPATWSSSKNHLIKSYYLLLDEFIEKGVFKI